MTPCMAVVYVMSLLAAAMTSYKVQSQATIMTSCTVCDVMRLRPTNDINYNLY